VVIGQNDAQGHCVFNPVASVGPSVLDWVRQASGAWPYP